MEQKLHKAQKNRELMELLELEKSLLYFSTSLRSNEVVLEKLMKYEKIKKYPEDEELLEDVVMAIPTMVASFYGMNVRGIPFGEHPYGFWIVLGFTAVVSMVVTLIFSKKDLF